MPTILVADDNSNIQKMVTLAFEERGMKVVAVGNGEAAVRRIPDVQPDVVLADVFMPVRNGYEVCEFVKKDERFAHVPVILLVGAFDPLDEKEARRVGADGVLKKPFIPPDPLIAMVTSALEKNPKVVAELAAAKAAPAERLPVPDPELLAKHAPQPQPEFPEPTGEEAAVAYGYGARAGVFVGEPQDGAAEPSENADAATGEAADEASESHDWRRSAMNFEVPEDVANQVPFSASGDFDTAVVPSERDAQPTKVQEADVVQDAEVVAEKPAADPVAPPAATAGEPAWADLFETTSEPPAAAAPVTKQPAPAPKATEVPAVVSAPKPDASISPDLTVEENTGAPAPSGYSGAAPVLSDEEKQPVVAAPSQPTDSSKLPDWLFDTDSGAGVPAEPVARDVSESTAPASHSESFFADEGADESPAEPVVPTQENSHTAPPQLAAGVAAPSVPEIELDPEDAEPPLAIRDPALEEPAAVKVVPEDLLVKDESEGPSVYDSHLEEIAPVYAFVVPESARANQQPDAEEDATAGQPLSEFRSGEGDSPAVDSETVDAVVRKVLEKLEPQLHDILAQGVLKPLVENILQNELAHKPK